MHSYTHKNLMIDRASVEAGFYAATKRLLSIPDPPHLIL
jgi:hypothetical protein